MANLSQNLKENAHNISKLIGDTSASLDDLDSHTTSNLSKIEVWNWNGPDWGRAGPDHCCMGHRALQALLEFTLHNSDKLKENAHNISKLIAGTSTNRKKTARHTYSAHTQRFAPLVVVELDAAASSHGHDKR